MGIGEGKDKEDTGSTGSRRRSLYRQGSLSSQVPEDGTFPLHMIDNDESGRPRGDSVGSGLRTRTPSGKSIRSRKASRAEYHEDLKPAIKYGMNRNLVFMAFIILIGNSFLFGYNIGVLNQPSQLIIDFFNETYTERSGEIPGDYTLTFLWSLTTTMFLPGGMIGAFSAGFLADKVGRKRAVLLSHIPAFIGAVISTLCVAASAPELLMIGRFITGINCGFATQLAPMYLAEITPYNLRGAFGTANQLFITIGIFMGSVFGLREILGTASGWPYLLLLNAVPAFLSLVIMPFLPESPRFLMLNQRKRLEAEKALRFLRMTLDVTADIEEMETEAASKEAVKSDEAKVGGAADEEEEHYTLMMLLRSKQLRMPLIIAVMLQVVQQLSGINAIFFYSKGIFEDAAVSQDLLQYCVMGTNAVNVLMTLVAVPVMDVAGRRPLLLYPMIVMVVVLGIITAALKLQETIQAMSFLSIACVEAYVICFAIGLGPIPMMIGAELFRQGPRPRAMSVAGFTNWLFTAIISISFELIRKAIEFYTFVIFLILMIFFTLFVFFFVPETKNKTFEEIASHYQKGADIEVEEIVEDDDDVFPAQELKGRLAEEQALMGRNGSVPSLNRQQSDDAERVTINMKPSNKNEDKVSLTKSQENVGGHVKI